MKKIITILSILLIISILTINAIAADKQAVNAKEESKKVKTEKEYIKAPVLKIATKDYSVNTDSGYSYNSSYSYFATWEPIEGAVLYKCYYGHDKDKDLETFADAKYKFEQNKDAIMARMKRNYDGSKILATEELKAVIGSYRSSEPYKRFGFFYITAVDKDGHESEPSNVLIHAESSYTE